MSVNSNGYLHLGGDIRNIYILLLLSLSFGTVTDIDGNVYETVQIGEQLWMAENLKVTHYNNGDEIPYPSDEDFGSYDEGQYGVYDNDPSNDDIYGNLYNWAVVDDDRGVCPEGWHVPTDEEYTILIDYLGGQFVVGGQMKSTGTIESGDGLWYSPNVGATNESGFTGLPAGYRHSIGAYHNMGTDGYYWSSSEYTSSEAWNQKLYYNNSYVTRGYGHKLNGYSIRCLSDETQTTTILVPEDFATIQEAIDYSIDGDTILVSAGTYYENINFNGKGIAIIGEDREITIIDGNQNGSVVVFESGESNTAVLSGFTITNGSGIIGWNNGFWPKGGGIYIYSSSPTLTNLIINNNSVIGFNDLGNGNSFGGGVYIYDAGLVVFTDVIIQNNTAFSGTGSWGGGIYVYGTNISFENVLLENNSVSGPYSSGGGLFINAVSEDILIANSILWNNSQDVIYVHSGSVTIKYSNIQGGWEGVGNINSDPLFTDPDNGDFTLQPSSPCIDAGDPNSPLDPDGSWADMGAYPYIHEADNCVDFHGGNNLISFSVLPPNGLDDFPECINAISGEGVAAIYTENGWVGSLTELSCGDGYWLVNTCSDFEWCYNGLECSGGAVHSLHLGSNLISYTLSDCGSIEEVLPDDVEDCIHAIAGEGVATLNTDFGWVGSLTSLCPNGGYWFVNQCADIEFTFNDPASFVRQQLLSPSPYPYQQSSQQVFYFVESIQGIKLGDWVLAYSGDEVVGARQWMGSIIDVPAMGDDGSGYTQGYMKAGETPTFKLLSNGKLTTLEGDIPAWSDNGLFMVSSLSKVIIPESYSLSQAYPNPFNPVTTLSFAIPVDSEVFLSIYNMQGREVSTLIDANMDAGYHSVVWNANSMASGVYFVKMVAGEFVNTQKLMLVK